MAEERAERRLAAILVADVVGYSRMMGEDETGTLARLQTIRKELLHPKVTEYGGRIVKTTGDGTLIEFPSAVDAVQHAVDVQTAIGPWHVDTPENQRIELRMGINVGDIIVEDDDIFGDGVNVAARLEGLAEPGGICISGTVFDQVKGKLDIPFDDLGAQEVKNIAEPVRVYQWSVGKSAAVGKTQPNQNPPLPDKPSIAVLPFENMSGDPEQEYFSDGITEDIITTLSKVPSLFVVARNSTFVYKGGAVDVKQVAAEQGVRYVLEGSVRKAGNRVRITAQLIDASSGMHAWADHFDGSLDDVFALQDEITQEIVSALEVSLTDGEQARLWRRRAGDPRVYEHILRGRDLYNIFTRRTNIQSRVEFEAAIRLNSSFPAAYSFLGRTYGNEVRWDWCEDTEQSLRMMYETTQKALELDPDLPDAVVSMAYHYLLQRSHNESVALAERALLLGPSDAEVHHVAAMIFNYSGLPEQGISVAKQVIRLSPMAHSNHMTELGHSHCLLGNHDEAIAILKGVLAEKPFWRSARALLVFALHEAGQVEKAQSEANEILRAAPRFSLDQWAGRHPYRRPDDLERYMGALRNAGLPE